MAYDVAAGPPGLEVIHSWQNTFQLNNRAERPSRIRLSRITGHNSGAEIEDNRMLNGYRGEFPLPAYKLGKTLVYEGLVQGKTLDGMRTKYQALKKAFWDTRTEQTMVLLGTQQWVYNARVMQFDGDDEQTNGREVIWPFQRAFTIGLRMSDARYYAVEQVVSSMRSVNTTDPTLTNLGSTDANPVFTVENVAAGATMQFYNGAILKGLRFTNLPAGTLVVDFQYRTATVNGVDVTGKIDTGFMSWWTGNCPGLIPGAQAVSCIASVSISGNWQVSFYHASS